MVKFTTYLLSILLFLVSISCVFAQSGAIAVRVPDRGYFLPGETITGTVSRYTNQMIYYSSVQTSNYMEVQNVKITLQSGAQYPPNIQLENFTVPLPHTFSNQDSMFIMIFSISGQTVGSNPFKIRSYTPVKMSAPVFPSHNSDKIPTTTRISWATSPKSAEYHIQLSTTNVFQASINPKENVIQENKLIINDSTYSDTSILLQTLAPLTWHYWRVRPNTPTGWGEWMTPAQFKTAAISGVNENPTAILPTIKVFPQPCESYGEIALGNGDTRCQYAVYSIIGELEFKSTEEIQTSSGTLIFPTNTLPSGIYMLMLRSGERTYTTSFAKK